MTPSFDPTMGRSTYFWVFSLSIFHYLMTVVFFSLLRNCTENTIITPLYDSRFPLYFIEETRVKFNSIHEKMVDHIFNKHYAYPSMLGEISKGESHES